MAVIRVQKVPKKTESAEDLICRFCFYFPRYSYQEARQLPHKRIVKMLKIAREEKARFLHDLTESIAAPHTKKGKGVNKMLKYFKDIINGNK